MIKVLHVMRSLNAGGIGAFVMNAYRKINNNNIQFDFALTYDGMGVYGEEIEELGGKIYYLSESGNEYLKDGVKQVVNLYKLCRTNKYNVVHCHFYFANTWFLCAAKFAGVPVRVSHCHNTRSTKRIGLARKVFESISRPLLFRVGTEFLACSVAAGEFLYGKAALNSHKANVLYNGINYEHFNVSNYDVASIKKEYKIADEKIFVFVGRFAEQKNPLYALKVYDGIKKKINNAKLFMIGYGSLEDEIKGYISTHGLSESVELLPPDTDVASIQAISDVMIAPSLWEGLSIAYIEAQKMETIVVASDQIPQEVDMGYCEFVSLDDEKKWINVIERVINSGEKERRYDKEKIVKFDINTTVKELMNYYGIDEKTYAVAIMEQ